MAAGDQAAGYGGTMVLPTISDFVLLAEQHQTAHTVYTPYVLRRQHRPGRHPTPQDAAAPRLAGQLSEIALDQQLPIMLGRRTATSAGQAV